MKTSVLVTIAWYGGSDTYTNQRESKGGLGDSDYLFVDVVSNGPKVRLYRAEKHSSEQRPHGSKASSVTFRQ